MGELGESIYCLKSKENFDEIITRLISKTEFWGAYYEIRSGKILFDARLKFDYIKRLKKKKTPDISYLNNREINFEITHMDHSKCFTDAYNCYNKLKGFLYEKFKSGDLDFYCNISDPIMTQKQIDDIILKIQELITIAEKQGCAKLHSYPGIDFFVFTEERQFDVPIKYRVEHYKMPFTYERPRIEKKIEEKHEKCNDKTPNIIMIFDQNIDSDDDMKKVNENLKNDLLKQINLCENLSAVIIYTEFFPVKEDRSDYFEETDEYIGIKNFDKIMARTRSVLIIINKQCNYPLNNEEIELLKKLFV